MSVRMSRQAMLDFCTTEELAGAVLSERERADVAEAERDDHEVARTLLEETLGQVMQERAALARFVRIACRAAGGGCDFSGDDIQALGVELGFLSIEAYCCDTHGEDGLLADLVPGEDIVYVETDMIREVE